MSLPATLHTYLQKHYTPATAASYSRQIAAYLGNCPAAAAVWQCAHAGPGAGCHKSVLRLPVRNRSAAGSPGADHPVKGSAVAGRAAAGLVDTGGAATIVARQIALRGVVLPQRGAGGVAGPPGATRGRNGRFTGKPLCTG